MGCDNCRKLSEKEFRNHVLNFMADAASQFTYMQKDIDELKDSAQYSDYCDEECCLEF